jgi:cytochrome-b5 reductase
MQYIDQQKKFLAWPALTFAPLRALALPTIMADVQQLIQLCQANPIPVAVALIAVIITVVMALRGSGAAKAFLDPQQFKPLSLIRIDQLTHNTKRFVFALPDPNMRLGLPTGQHITFLAKDDEGKDVYR